MKQDSSQQRWAAW